MKNKYNYAYDECEIIKDRVKYILENKEDFDYLHRLKDCEWIFGENVEVVEDE